MINVNIALPDPMLKFIDQQVGPEGFQDRQAVITAAVADMQERVAAFNAAVQEGLDAEATGDFEEVDDLQAWFAGLRERAAA